MFFVSRLSQISLARGGSISNGVAVEVAAATAAGIAVTVAAAASITAAVVVTVICRRACRHGCHVIHLDRLCHCDDLPVPHADLPGSA